MPTKKIPIHVRKMYLLALFFSALITGMVGELLMSDFRTMLVQWFPNPDTAQMLNASTIAEHVSIFGKYFTTNELVSAESALVMVMVLLVVWIAKKDYCLAFMNRHFVAIMIIDAIIFTVVSIVSTHKSPFTVLFRMFSLALFSTIGWQVWDQVTTNAWNQIYILKEATRFSQDCKQYMNWGRIIGYILMMFLGGFLEFQDKIHIQMVGYWVSTATELYVWPYINPDKK